MAAVISPLIKPLDPIKTDATQAASFKAPTLGTANEQTVQSPQTLQGQLSGIMSSGSPLLEQAKTRALQGMNARGLINSSMAIGAGESAMYDAALPIAQFDASRYSDVANRNQDAGNQFKLQQFGADTDATKTSAAFAQDAGVFNAGEANKASLAGAQIGAQRENLQTEVGAQKDRLAMEISSREAISKLDNETREQMAKIEAGYKVQMQSQDSAARLFDQISVQMSQIALNKDLSPEAKRNATTMLMGQLTNGLNILGSVANLNLSSILKFDGLEKMFNTSTVEGLQGAGGAAAPLPAAGGTTGTPTAGGGMTGGLIGGEMPAGTPVTQSASAGQSHLDNQLAIARMPTAQREFLGTEYQKAIESGAAPAQAYQQATNNLNDPEAHRATLNDPENTQVTADDLQRFQSQINTTEYQLQKRDGWRDPTSPEHYRQAGDRTPADQAFDYLLEQGKNPLEAAAIVKAHIKRLAVQASEPAPGIDYGGGSAGSGEGSGTGAAAGGW